MFALYNARMNIDLADEVVFNPVDRERQLRVKLSPLSSDRIGFRFIFLFPGALGSSGPLRRREQAGGEQARPQDLSTLARTAGILPIDRLRQAGDRATVGVRGTGGCRDREI